MFFDWSSLSGAVINSATLYYHSLDHTAPGMSFSEMLGTYGPTSFSWNTQPALASAPLYSGPILYNSAGSVPFDVSALTQTINNNHAIMGVIIPETPQGGSYTMDTWFATNTYIHIDYSASSPTPTSTPTPTPTPAPVVIAVSPSSSNVTVGTPFNVDVVVNGGGQIFNAAQATVSLSSNLTVSSLHNPTANACNLQYTQTPSASNTSFAGAIFNGSSTNCKVYSLTIIPSSVGTGTITLTNGAIKSYADASEILTGVTNGTYTITSATPTPLPTGSSLLTLDDSIQGTEQNQWNYVGSWGHCASCNDSATFYNASISWDNTTDDSVTFSFTGTQVQLYGFTDPRNGIGAASIDGGPETMIDFYAPTRAGNILLWSSPALSATSHTLRLRVTGTHSANATDNYIGPDRVDIVTTTITPTPTVLNLTLNNYALDTYNSTVVLSGTKDTAVTNVFVDGSDANSTYPTDTTWQSTVSLSLGANTFSLYGTDIHDNQTATTQGITINRHATGDINGDSVVDLTDASLFAVDWGKTGDLTYTLSDMNGDGTVDLTDFSILAKLIQ